MVLTMVCASWLAARDLLRGGCRRDQLTTVGLLADSAFQATSSAFSSARDRGDPRFFGHDSKTFWNRIGVLLSVYVDAARAFSQAAGTVLFGTLDLEFIN